MLTIRATLEPSGHVQLPPFVHCEKPTPVLLTFLDEPVAYSTALNSTITSLAAEKGSVAATLALLQSPEFRLLPKADAAEVEQRIQELRNDWDES